MKNGDNKAGRLQRQVRVSGRRPERRSIGASILARTLNDRRVLLRKSLTCEPLFVAAADQAAADVDQP